MSPALDNTDPDDWHEDNSEDQPFEVDDEGRVFYEGSWILTLTPRPAGPARLAEVEVHVASVRPRMTVDDWQDDRRRQAERVATVFGSEHVPLDEWLRHNRPPG